MSIPGVSDCVFVLCLEEFCVKCCEPSTDEAKRRLSDPMIVQHKQS